jgi:hypothetical protein
MPSAGKQSTGDSTSRGYTATVDLRRLEDAMTVRMRVLLLIVFLSTSLAITHAKKKPAVPAYVLKAHTVAVLIDPEAGTSLTDPMANKTAQDDVEKALLKWGRLSPVMDPGHADLVIVIRKGSGKIAQRTITNLPTNDRPIVVQQTDNSIRLGGQQGRAPGAPAQTEAQDTRPTQQTEIGSSSEDMFAVYPGGSETDGRPSDRSAAWRYEAKDALHSPNVPAVAEFRKAIEETEKQQKSKP